MDQGFDDRICSGNVAFAPSIGAATAAIQSKPPRIFDLCEHWLVDAGTREVLCPSFKRGDERDQHACKVTPELFETAKGNF